MKARRSQLISRISHVVEAETGFKNWDPLIILALISARAFTGYEAKDENGNPILDRDGRPVVIPPDYSLAAATAAKVAPYIHSPMASSPPEESKDAPEDPEAARQRVIDAFIRMGIEVKDAES